MPVKTVKSWIQIVFPAPLLSVFLCILWLLLNRSASIGHIALGLLLGFCIPVFTRGLRPLPVSVSSPWGIVKLALVVVHDTCISNFQVIRILVAPRLRRYESGFVHIPLDLRDPNGLAALAMINCLTPGTAWAEISRDRSMLLIHVLELGDKEEVIRFVKTRYEKPLMQIFESRA